MNVTTHALRLRAALPACLITCSALLLTACGSEKGSEVSAAAAAPSGSPTTTTSPTGTASPTGSPSPTGTATRLTDDQAERRALVPAAKVTWDKAAGTAVGEVSGSKLVAIELTRAESGSTASPAPSPGSPEWAAEVATQDGTRHTVHIDAASGRVLRSQPDREQDAEDKQETADLLSKAELTAEQAVKTATGRKKGTVTVVELDSDDAGKVVWSVDVVTQDDWYKTTFDVDAAGGEILREEVDRD
ncbi:PepSY domain-containing protein [Streptomyces sp. V1I6]|uniref:PepSY domain-containing protein n=1 Tax=Streptomyces sp. V1I6 TaxID=3042273 RepID=UPI0027891C0E|nr:PepSY domain-containing protein [Streptomyces sp. V1I6]MDQ0840983.1 putative membrane protein YkoI [Streptomyces sp. V1I6]